MIHLMKFRFLQTTLACVPICWAFSEYLYTVKVVSGTSMQPTLNPDNFTWRDVAIFDRRSIQFLHKYRRGDVVALVAPTNKGGLLVKRIIALEGDVVKTLPPYPDAAIVVPQGHAWVEGDDHWRSRDSNHFGPIPLSLIDSRLVNIVWPPSRFGSFRSKPWSGNETGYLTHSRVKVGHLKNEWKSD